MDPDLIYRHRLPVRVMHWINVICLVVLLGSGLQIFNAHPALYWGADSRAATLLVNLPRFPGWATIPGRLRWRSCYKCRIGMSKRAGWNFAKFMMTQE